MIELSSVQGRLGAYLKAVVAYLRVLASGWETTIFEFALGHDSPVCPSIPPGASMVLRLYEGDEALDKSKREHCAMRQLASVGYPVPHLYHFEPELEPLGAPFLIMERLVGGPLFTTRNFAGALKTFLLGFFPFVRTQARLHRLDVGDARQCRLRAAFGIEGQSAEAPLLDRVLATIAQRIERGPLPELHDALCWASERAGALGAGSPSLVHMDYHPRNVVVSGSRLSGVIDWVNADLGDRYLDAATTAVILSSHAMDAPVWMRDNARGDSLRKLFDGLYVALYHALYPMDFARFRYCQAVAALLRLSMLGMMRVRGAESVGFRAEALQEVTPTVIRILARYTAQKSGVQVPFERLLGGLS